MTPPAETVADALGARIVRQFSGGAFGAFHIRTAPGNDAVLKVLPDWPEYTVHRVETAADIVHGLIADGYPAPRFLDVGAVGNTVYSVQEYIAAQVPQQLPGNAPAALLGLYRRHQSAAPGNFGGTWGAELIERIHRVGELRKDTTDTRIHRLVDRALDIANTSDPEVFRTTDAVHGDFHPGNVLVEADAITIIDWESARAGDSRADVIRMYAAMASWSHPGATLFRDEIDRTTPPEVRRSIAAEIVALHLRYALHAEPDALEWAVREAETLLGGP